jgi:hypothetical protein
VFARACEVNPIIEWVGNVNYNAALMWDILNKAHTDEEYPRPLVFTLFVGNMVNILSAHEGVHPMVKWVAKAYHEWTRASYNITGRLWEDIEESYHFFYDNFFTRPPIMNYYTSVLVGSGWRPLPSSVPGQVDTGCSLALAEVYTTATNVAEIFRCAQYGGVRSLPVSRDDILTHVPHFIETLVGEHVLQTVDEYLVVPYTLSLEGCHLNHTLEQLRLIMLCPGVDVCDILVDFTSFRLVINDVLKSYTASNVILILTRIFAHINSLTWLVQYIVPHRCSSLDLLPVEPFDSPVYDVCRLPPHSSEDEAGRAYLATRKVFTLQQTIFLLILIHEVADVASLIRLKVSFGDELVSGDSLDEAVVSLVKQGSPLSHDVDYLFLPPEQLIACAEVISEHLGDFQYFADHISHNTPDTDNIALVRDAWSAATVQLAFMYARRVFMWATGFSELYGGWRTDNETMYIRDDVPLDEERSDGENDDSHLEETG